jgi:hypothetical protein
VALLGAAVGYCLKHHKAQPAPLVTAAEQVVAEEEGEEEDVETLLRGIAGKMEAQA